ncbi:hypothetical protein F5Y18DRAFT_389516 [Xylariaceae sp. FL1019]|nr:hypothetical protein F5Y18DRAFT_389516 [Xylariaceae sp. FL1019]
MPFSTTFSGTTKSVTTNSDDPTKKTAETSITSTEKSPNKASTTTKGTTLTPLTSVTTPSSVITPSVINPAVITSVITVTEPATPAAPNKTVTPSVKAPIEPLKTPQKPQATFDGAVKPAIAATVETSLKPTTVATIHPARPSPNSLNAGEMLTVNTNCNSNLKKAKDLDIVTLKGLLTPKAHNQDHLFGTSNA